MKKASLILVVLLLVVGMSLSAEGKWTNWGEGIVYPIYKVGNADLTAGWGPWAWNGFSAPAGIYQEWHFAYDGDNFGYEAMFAFNDSFTPIALQHFNVYFKPFDMLKLTMGAPRINTFRTTTFIEGSDNGSRLINGLDSGGYAAEAELTPISGLTAGAAMYVNDMNPAVATSTMDWERAFGFGATYSMMDMGAIFGLVRLDNEYANIGVNVTAVQGVGLMASFTYDWTSGADFMKILASAKAALGPVNVAIDGGLQTNQGALVDTMVFGADVDAGYPIDMMWTVGATVGYDNGLGLVGSGAGTPGMGFSLFPYVMAGFGDSSVKLGFIYATGYDAHGSVGNAEAVIAIPLMYVISY